MSRAVLFDYFERVSIIHLRERTDRAKALRSELAFVGLDMDDPKVSIPDAPKPDTTNGFSSRGVYGNFLSHLDIIRRAYEDGLDAVLVLEDDALFGHSFNRHQATIANYLRQNPWDQLFLGHSITTGLPASSSGLVRFTGDFLWAHCYAVHRRIMPRMIEYFQQTIERPAGDPDGGKMYIDAAHTFFRKRNPEIICLISSPCMCIQRGSQSSLNSPPWYDRTGLTTGLAAMARNVRDECWRRGLIGVGPKGDVKSTIASAIPWPDSTKESQA
jgi:glycosyl transferase, family 25